MSVSSNCSKKSIFRNCYYVLQLIRQPCARMGMSGAFARTPRHRGFAQPLTRRHCVQGEMMRQLKHPGIVKLLGVSIDSGSFYLVQEVVNGLGNRE